MFRLDEHSLRPFRSAPAPLFAASDCRDVVDGARPDSEFHLALARASCNPLILRLYQRINVVRAHAPWKQMTQIIPTPEKMALCNTQHRAIVEAPRHRDLTGAGDLVARHRDQARQDSLGTDNI